MPRVIEFLVISTLLVVLGVIKSHEEEAQDLDLDKVEIKKEIYDILPGIKIKSKEQLDKTTKESDLTFLAFYFVKESKNSYIVANFLPGVSKKLEFLAEILLIDCDLDNNKDLSECKNNSKPEFYPKLFALIPPQYKVNPYTKKVATYSELRFTEESVSEQIIYNFISKHITNKAIKLNSDNHKAMIGNPNMNKVLLFTNKPQSGLIFKGLSGFYYDRILFLEVYKDETNLISQYNIKRYPTLLVLETLEEDLETVREQPEIHEYSGNLKAKDISEYISKYVLPEKLYLSSKQGNKQSSEEFSKEKLLNSLVKKIKGEAIVPFFEKNSEKRIILWVSKEENVTETIINFARKTNGFFTFVSVSCNDQENQFFCSKIKGKLPQLLLLNKLGLPWTNRLSNHVSLQSTDNYDDLIQEVLSEIKSNVEVITRETFQSHTFNTMHKENKVPCIYFFKQGEVDIVLHLISTDEELRNYVTFFGYSDPNPDAMKELGIRSLPDTVILAKDPLNPEK